MITGLEADKIKRVETLLIEGFLNTKEERIFFSFEDLKKEPLLKDEVGREKTLNTIQDGSSGKISWKTKNKTVSYTPSVAQDDPRPRWAQVPIGIEIHVTDPNRIKNYITDVILQVKRNNEKEEILISEKKGICRADGKSYPISGKRFKLVLYLFENENVRLSTLEKVVGQTKVVVVQSIKEINKNFREKLGTSDKLITHIDTSAYNLNKSIFKFKKE